MTAKIVQIIPAVGWECVYGGDEGKLYGYPLIGFWLDSDGETGIADMDIHGYIDYRPEKSSNFIAVQHRDYPTVAGTVTRGDEATHP